MRRPEGLPLSACRDSGRPVSWERRGALARRPRGRFPRRPRSPRRSARGIRGASAGIAAPRSGSKFESGGRPVGWAGRPGGRCPCGPGHSRPGSRVPSGSLRAACIRCRGTGLSSGWSYRYTGRGGRCLAAPTVSRPVPNSSRSGPRCGWTSLSGPSGTGHAL